MKKRRTIHFVYATPRSFTDKIAMRLFNRKLFHPSWERYKWPIPVPAPLSITYQVAKSLSADFRVKLYDLRERIEIVPVEGDILLGHMWPDPDSIMWRAIDNPKFSRRYLISPYNHDPVQVTFLREALGKCDKFFAICGQYWLDTFDQSPMAEFRAKFVRLEMGIDMADYPLVKTSFNPPGKRKFFYIGRIGNEKGVDLLEKIATEIPGFSGGYICMCGDIKGWEKIAEPRKLTPDFMRQVAEEYDIFINMSRADAQVTTVLEAMCWGFPVACTRQSGYTEDNSLYYLELTDEEKTVSTLKMLQEIDSTELKRIADINRKIVADKYNWRQFVTTISDCVTKDIYNDVRQCD